jgi:hypothetical protein
MELDNRWQAYLEEVLETEETFTSNSHSSHLRSRMRLTVRSTMWRYTMGRTLEDRAPRVWADSVGTVCLPQLSLRRTAIFSLGLNPMIPSMAKVSQPSTKQWSPLSSNPLIITPNQLSFEMREDK